MKKLHFKGPVLTASGYGVHARQLLKALVDCGQYDIHVESINWGNTPFLMNDEGLSWIHPLIEARYGDPERQHDVSVQVTIPNEFKRCARVTIGVTAGIEVDRVSPEWLVKCNSEVDVVIVPSRHSESAFRVAYQGPNGEMLALSVPLLVVPEGVDTNVFSRERLSKSDLLDGMPDKNFVFTGLGLNHPNGQDRKNVTRLVEWFCRAFAGRDDVGLVLKTSIVNGSLVDFETTKRRVADIKSSTGCGELPRVRVIHGRMSDDQMAQLYTDLRMVAMVSLTHGEGYGLPLIEAAACGLPVIATDWSGHLDFLRVGDEKVFLPVEYDMAEIPEPCVWPGVMEKGTRWANPREQSFVNRMHEVLGDTIRIKAHASRLAAEIEATLSIPKVSETFVSTVDRVVTGVLAARPGNRTETIAALKSRYPESSSWVLFTMPMSAGDVYLSTALVPHLKKRHPGKKIILATLPQYAEIGEGTFDEVVQWDQWMVDVGLLEDVFGEVYTPNLSIQMNHSNWVHKGRGRNILKEMAVQCGLEPPMGVGDSRFLVPEMAAAPPLRIVDRLVDMVAQGKKIVGIHTGAGKGQWGARRYSHWDGIVSNLKEAGLSVVQIGAADDMDVKGVDLDLRSQGSYRQLPQVLKNFSALLCIDSFPMHVAHRLGVPVVALFGGSYPTSTGPISDGKTKLVMIETPDRKGCDRACYKNECSVDKHDPCINEIPPAQVYEHVLYVANHKRERTYVEKLPKISGYTHILNPKSFDYPFIESIKSMLGFCDEVVVVDGGSTDGSKEMVEAIGDPRVKVFVRQWDWNEPGMDGMQKAFGRAMCDPDADFLWQQDADEVVHEDDYEKIKRIAKKFPADIQLIHLPVVELWGSPKRVRTDRHSWKWRMSRNDFRITHGIVAQARAIDPKTGRLHAKKGMSDGCEYIDVITGEYVPHKGFYSREIEELRTKLPEEYGRRMNAIFEELPCVFHYSWCDLSRKIKNFKQFWNKCWSNLYNDPAPEDRFPDVKTDDDVLREAQDLHLRGGEHGAAPVFKLKRTNPAIMEEWLSRGTLL